MSQGGFTGQGSFVEEGGGPGAEAAGLEVAAFVEEKEALIEIEKPGPDEIFLGGEHGARFCEPFKGVDSLALLPVGNGFVGESFCSFIAHAELLETKKTLVSHFAGFFAEVELEIDFGKIEVAESEVIGVAGDLAGAARGEKHFNGAAVFAAKIVEVGDVVVGLIAQERHVVADAEFARFLDRKSVV